MSLEAIVPKDIKLGRPMRIFGRYAIPLTQSFERDLLQFVKLVFVAHWASDISRFHEFGCGTGYNLISMAEAFPTSRYIGYDWSSESLVILDSLSERFNILGRHFDFFNPDDSVPISQDDCVLSFAALEQVGDQWHGFLNLILNKKPKIILQMEPCFEEYNQDLEFDELAMQYHSSRNYLSGYFTELKRLSSIGAIEILFFKRLGVGSLYHEATTFIAWRVNSDVVSL